MKERILVLALAVFGFGGVAEANLQVSFTQMFRCVAWNSARLQDKLNDASCSTVYAFPRTYGPMTIRRSVVLRPYSGRGPVILDGGSASTALAIQNTAGVVQLHDIIIQNGHSSGHGGGIYSNGTLLYLTNVEVSDSYAIERGGGIYLNGGALSMNGGVVHNNQAGRAGGGIYGEDAQIVVDDGRVAVNVSVNGGGIYAVDSDVEFTSSDVENNAASFGGGGYLTCTNSSSSCQTRFIDSTISENTVDYDGSGLYANSNVELLLDSSVVAGNGVSNRPGVEKGAGVYFSGSVLEVESSSIDNNGPVFYGGGIYTYCSNGCQVNILNSTVSNNHALVAGGGIDAGFDANVSIESSTFSGNEVENYSGSGGFGGAIRFAGDTLDIERSTIVENFAGDGSAIYVFSFPSTLDISNTIMGLSTGGDVCSIRSSSQNWSSGWNLSDDSSCRIRESTDHPNTSFTMGPLNANGGLTDTHLPLSTPPIANGGGCTASMTDQTGASRSRCSIGAVD